MWPLNHTEDKIKSKGPWHVLKQAELQPETPCMQSFGAKSGASARQRRTSRKKLCAERARASGPAAQQFENPFESPDALLSNAV